MRARGVYTVLYCTDVDEENIIEHRQPSSCRHTESIQAMEKANDRFVAAIACSDTVVHHVDGYKGEDDGKDPIQSRQREHKSCNGEEPFP